MLLGNSTTTPFELQFKKVEHQIKKAEVQFKNTEVQFKKAEVHFKKAEVQFKKDEVHFKKAEVQIKTAMCLDFTCTLLVWKYFSTFVVFITILCRLLFERF